MYKYCYILILVTIVMGCDNLNRRNPKDVHHGNYLFFAADTNDLDDGDYNTDNLGNDISGPNIKIHDVSIAAETINDNLISAGESLTLNVVLENNGDQDASNVTVRYICTSSFVSDLRPTSLARFSSNGAAGAPLIYSGSTARCIMPSQELSFQIASYATPGLPVEIDLIIEDDQGNIWTESILIFIQSNVTSNNSNTGSLGTTNTTTSTNSNTSTNNNSSTGGTTISNPQVEFDRYELYSEANFDRVISRGERVRVATYIINTGNVKVFSPQVTITADPMYLEYIQAHNDVNYYSMENSVGFNIPVGWDAKPMYAYQFLTFKTRADLPPNTIIPFQIVIKTASNRTYSETFYINIE